MGKIKRVTVKRVQSKVAEDTNERKEKYTIYNYFIKHPSSIIVLLSSIVTIVSFFAQATTYIINKNSLEYWNIDTSYASLSNTNLLYSVIAAMVYTIVMAFSSTWFIRTSEVYIERKRFFLACDLFYKKHKKINKAQHERIVFLKKSPTSSSEEIKDIEKETLYIREEIEQLEEITKEDKKDARTQFILNVIPILLVVIFAALVLSFVFAPKQDFVKSTTVTLLMHGTTCLITFFIEQKRGLNKKKIKQDVEKMAIAEVFDLCRLKKEYPIFSVLSKGKGISNSTIVLQIIQTVFVCLLILAFLVISGINSEKDKREFQIAHIANEMYAVVYRNEDLYFMEKAIIEDDKIIIRMNEQRILSTTDISFTVKEFSIVERAE